MGRELSYHPRIELVPRTVAAMVTIAIAGLRWATGVLKAHIRKLRISTGENSFLLNRGERIGYRSVVELMRQFSALLVCLLLSLWLTLSRVESSPKHSLLIRMPVRPR